MISIGVAAGHVKRPSDVERLLQVPSDVLRSITLGSYTLDPRDGNPGDAFWTNGDSRPTSINSLGLPNPGIDKASDYLWDIADAMRKNGMICRVSIAGFSPKEFRTMARKLLGLGIFEIELNLGCPNVWDGGSQKRIASFVPELIRETLEQVYDVTDHVSAPSVAVKLSVYSDPFLQEQIATVLTDMGRMVQTVVLCNTFPNGVGYADDGKTVISAADGYGGLAGLPLKHVALGHVRNFRRLLPSTIDIIGVGGISTGRDVLDMERAGASSVQIGTAYFANADPSVFVDIMTQYAELSEA